MSNNKADGSTYIVTDAEISNRDEIVCKELGETNNSISANLCSFSNSVLLATASVKVYPTDNNFIVVRVLIDQCSQSSFFSEFVCQRLNLKRQSLSFLISGVGGKRSCTCSTFVNLNIGKNFHSEFNCSTYALVLFCRHYFKQIK